MLYLIVVFCLWYFVGGLPPTDLLRGLLRSSLAFVLVLLATRVFRVREETNAPRPWWRATGRPLAGFVIGALFAVAVISLCANAYGFETDRKLRLYSGEDVFDAVSAVLAAALAVYYFTSSIRLRGIAREALREAERKGVIR
jgi:hypothetical protein